MRLRPQPRARTRCCQSAVRGSRRSRKRDSRRPRGKLETLSATVLRSVLDQLSLAIFVFRGERLIYRNPPATRLVNRLRTNYRIELLVMLLDHLAQSRDRSQENGTAIALTGQDNEPFVVHLMELRGRHGDIAVSIRDI